jgi:hypothetical protein
MEIKFGELPRDTRFPHTATYSVNQFVGTCGWWNYGGIYIMGNGRSSGSIRTNTDLTFAGTIFSDNPVIYLGNFGILI